MAIPLAFRPWKDTNKARKLKKEFVSPRKRTLETEEASRPTPDENEIEEMETPQEAEEIPPIEAPPAEAPTTIEKENVDDNADLSIISLHEENQAVVLDYDHRLVSTTNVPSTSSVGEIYPPGLRKTRSS